ncbi:hypothetical protein Tco_0351646 [Tanacetum coccineum]
MSQPANDDFSQHLSDDEASYHEDASDNGTATNKPKQQQQQLIPTTTTISNIKLPILKKEEYDIWAMEMEHYLEYIDNDVWKVIQNGNSKKRISTGKDGVVRVLPPVSAAEIHAVEKERIGKNTYLWPCPRNIDKISYSNNYSHSWKLMVLKWLLRMKLVASFRISLDKLKTSLITGLKSLDQIMALNLRIGNARIIVEQGNKMKSIAMPRTLLQIG